MSFQKMYGFEGLGLSEVQLSISELSVVDFGGWVVQTNALHGRTWKGSDKKGYYKVQGYQKVQANTVFERNTLNELSVSWAVMP